MTDIRTILKEAPEYYHSYIMRVKDRDPMKYMEKQIEIFDDFLDSIDPDMFEKSYAEGKWTIKEVVGHIIDCERIFAYRALRISRGDKTPLPGFEENDYIKASGYNYYEMDDLQDEFHLLRQANQMMFKNLSDNELSRTGIANDQEISARAIMYIMCGHVTHHMMVIKERYLKKS
ncbi:MAG: DinB family protein [Bacteroidia bacterium]|nr:DinB family protein [Bacteroidia bacterium]